jgi:hypothetical protein
MEADSSEKYSLKKHFKPTQQLKSQACLLALLTMINFSHGFVIKITKRLPKSNPHERIIHG